MDDKLKTILLENLKAREDEVFFYQVNITNFERAIAKIGDDEDLAEFKAHLEQRLASEKLEQRKAQIILEVLSDQLVE